MVFDKSTSAQSGDNGISIVGDGNIGKQININSSLPSVLPRSLLLEICKRITAMDIEIAEYSIQENTDWMRKFEFNGVAKYIDIFDDYSDGYDVLCEVLKSIPRSTLMIKKIRTVYIKVKTTERINENGDYILEQIFNKLKEEVCVQGQIGEFELLDEEVDAAIYLIMFYAFTKCKILEVIS
ncbi:hypothetical protein Q7W11_09240 [Streptococcus suis]|nr:hypothetical protein [Streptococcus suis]